MQTGNGGSHSRIALIKNDLLECVLETEAAHNSEGPAEHDTSNSTLEVRLTLARSGGGASARGSLGARRIHTYRGNRGQYTPLYIGENTLPCTLPYIGTIHSFIAHPHCSGPLGRARSAAARPVLCIVNPLGR